MQIWFNNTGNQKMKNLCIGKILNRIKYCCLIKRSIYLPLALFNKMYSILLLFMNIRSPHQCDSYLTDKKMDSFAKISNCDFLYSKPPKRYI